MSKILLTGGMPVATAITGAASLHHVGFVVGSILTEVENFAAAIEANWEKEIIFDPEQKARVTFLTPRRPVATLIELVEPAGEGSPILQFLQKGGGLHHLCYEVSNLELHMEQVRRAGAVIVRRPRPAVAFGHRRIVWAVTKQRLLLEFLERQSSSSFNQHVKEVTNG